MYSLDVAFKKSPVAVACNNADFTLTFERVHVNTLKLKVICALQLTGMLESPF